MPAADGPALAIALVEHFGGSQVLTLAAGDVRLTLTEPPSARHHVGERLAVTVDPAHVYLFHPETGRTLAAPGLTPSE